MLGVDLGRHGFERDRAPGGPAQVVGNVTEGHQPRPGHLVDLAVVTGLGERGHHDVGDVIEIDERFGDVGCCRQGDHTVEHRRQEEVLTEVLVEPAPADDRPLDAGRRDHLLGALRFGLAPSREQHQPADSHARRRDRERADGLDCAGKRQVRCEGDVRRLDPVEHRRPGVRVRPVELRVRAPGRGADGQVERLQPGGDAPTGLAGCADDEREPLDVVSWVHGSVPPP